jgi:hypothetical protein
MAAECTYAGHKATHTIATLPVLQDVLAALLLLCTLQSWLLPHKTANQHYWQYGYELRFTNSSEEPLQLLRKAWEVTELSGTCTMNSSSIDVPGRCCCLQRQLQWGAFLGTVGKAQRRLVYAQ